MRFDIALCAVRQPGLNWVEFFERVREAYLARARAEPQRMAIIDAVASMDEVAKRVTEVLGTRSWIS